jgi:hypothetical protein
MVLYLGIPQNSLIDQKNFQYRQIWDFLSGWLNSCCGQVRPVIINMINRPVPDMTRFDALVYLVGDPQASVIARVGAPQSTDLATGRTSGWQGKLISEVYVNNRAPYPIAATIYHELLHNRFNLAVNIHHTADGNFTSAQAPFFEGGPSAADQKLMCQALQELPLAGQYLDGF